MERQSIYPLQFISADFADISASIVYSQTFEDFDTAIKFAEINQGSVKPTPRMRFRMDDPHGTNYVVTFKSRKLLNMETGEVVY